MLASVYVRLAHSHAYLKHVDDSEHPQLPREDHHPHSSNRKVSGRGLIVSSYSMYATLCHSLLEKTLHPRSLLDACYYIETLLVAVRDSFAGAKKDISIVFPPPGI